MLAAIVHLSDLHLGEQKNPLELKLCPLAAAICSTDSRCRHYIIVLSGDIAYHGTNEEYMVATRLIKNLEEAITSRLHGAQTSVLAVPGNHDCVLPEKAASLRSALINAIEPSLQTGAPDAAILESLLAAQTNYYGFCQSLGLPQMAPDDKLCTTTTVQVEEKRIQFALYNTALVSKRHEEQGQLSVPVELIRSRITVDTNSDLTVSVYHHPQPWLQADVGIAFRNHIENTCEIALTGHQHADHGFIKQTLAGQRLLYSEGDVLQDPGRADQSGFRVIVLDLDSYLRKVVSYRWKTDRYSRVHDGTWETYTRTALGMALPSPSASFLDTLSYSGLGLTQKLLGPVPLEAVFVYPDAIVSPLSESDAGRQIKGEQLRQYLTESTKVVVRGAAYSGKSSLAKMVVRHWLRERSFFPLLISGAEIKQSDNAFFERLVNTSAAKIYGEHGSEQYQQLSQPERALVIDDWDESRLAHDGRNEFLRRALDHFGKVVLFVRGVSYIQYLLSQIKGADVLLTFDLVSLKELSHVGRGALIDKWLNLQVPRDSGDFTRRIVETERLVQSVIGKNTLPSVPLIVLAILEASERTTDVLPENGSFGYLYEVLITSALNLTPPGEKAQLDKKYTFLSILAFRLFDRSLEVMGATEVDALLDEYAQAFRVKVDKASLLRDLQYARVLVKDDGNYSFGYAHYFHYFLARYFKDNLSAPQGARLRELLTSIVSGLNTGTNSIFLMFVIYLTHDNALMDELIQIGQTILSDVTPSDLTSEVEFYNSKDFAGVQRNAPDAIDLEASRQRRREAADRATDHQGGSAAAKSLGPVVAAAGYTDALPLTTKIDYAMHCIEILGQVLRNFTGSLPGNRKLQILQTTYVLGLRALRMMLESLQDATLQAKKEFAKRDMTKSEDRQFVKRIEHLLTVIGQMVGAGMIHMISINIGSPDIDERAYSETLAHVGVTNATELLDLAIRLDHSKEYPFGCIRSMYAAFEDNRFAQMVLRDLVIDNMHVFDIGREMRQRVLGVLKAGRPSEAAISRTGKRLK